MRHQKQRGKLSRDSAHRKALFMNLCREVIDHERIQTTEAKAKAVKPELERLITLAKKGDHHSRRLAMARLGQDKFVVYKLFEEIAPRYAEREGGYTRILKLGPAQVGFDRDGLPRARLALRESAEGIAAAARVRRAVREQQDVEVELVGQLAEAALQIGLVLLGVVHVLVGHEVRARRRSGSLRRRC